MRKLVTLYQLQEDPTPIPGADNIELVQVKGWQCVVKKGEFRKDSFGLYFEIDSFVPTEEPAFAFLAKSARTWQGKTGAVIKTMKLRGQLSQGLFLPMSSFPGIAPTKALMEEEYDFSDELNVYKYDKEPEVIEDRSHWLHKLIRKVVPRKYRKYAFGVFKYFIPDKRVEGGGRRACSIPSFLKKTDEERIQNLFHKLTEEQKNGVYLVTIKLDGSSAQYYIKDNVFGLTSRNVKRSISDGSHFAQVAIKYNLQEVLEKWYAINKVNISVCGELMGPGIQGNREGLSEFDLYVFNIWNIDDQRYMSKDERDEVLKELKTLGCNLKQVPSLGHSRLDIFAKVEDFLDSAEGPSLNNPVREGVVFQKLDGSFSFKAISDKYLLQQKD